MSRTRRITVKIAGKEYAMTVPQDDEEKYRRAAREINELISAYKGSFVAEPEDYLAMAAMQVAVNKVNLEMDRAMSDQIDALDEIGRELDSYLNDIKQSHLRSLHRPGTSPHGFLFSFAKLNTLKIGVKLSNSKTGLTLLREVSRSAGTLDVCE